MHLRWRPAPGHELINARLRPTIDETGQHIGEVDLGIDLIQLAGFDKRRDPGPVCRTLIAAAEETIFS
jgi:hypothetical protein